MELLITLNKSGKNNNFLIIGYMEWFKFIEDDE